MFIEFALDKNATSKQKGDLLENLAKKILEIQNYEVISEMRKTGIEIDLFCIHKKNNNKKIFVECKAYKRNNNIQTDIIYTLLGKLEAKKKKENIEEVWLITSSKLGKEAKGLKDELIVEQQRKDIVFFESEDILSLLKNVNMICDFSLIEKELLQKDIINKKNIIIKEYGLLITDFGYFYYSIINKNGNNVGIVLNYSKTGEIVEENELLDKINNLESFIKDENLDIFYIFKKLKNQNIYKLSKEYLQKLNEIEIPLTHPSKINVLLDDLFIYPDLKNLDDENFLNSEQIIKDNLKNCIFFGEDTSGKTSLAKQFQKRLNEKEYLPVFLNAQDIKKSDKQSLYNKLYRNFVKQYIEIEKEEFLKFIEDNKDKFAIIIDNFDEIGIKRDESKRNFLKILNEEFKLIYIFIHDKLELEYMTKGEYKNNIFNNFYFFKIKELGHKKRDELIEKWLILGKEDELSDNEIFEKKDSISKFINLVVKNKYIPTYPIYVISLLQQLEAGKNNNISNNSYVEFYRFLISQSLNNLRIKQDEFELYYSYLSFIAYNYFVKKTKFLTKEELLEIHQVFIEEIKKTPFLLDKLVKSKILKEDEGKYKFTHNYLYYFFVAKYLSDNMSKRKKKEEIKIHLDKIMNHLYVEEYANIIIFFIHHSQSASELIIDNIINQAKILFEEIEFLKMDYDDFVNINETIDNEIKIIYDEEVTPKEFRTNRLQIIDSIEEKKLKNLNNKEEKIEHLNKDDLDVFAKINFSMKLIEILAQIVKSYYAHLDYDEKVEIIEEVIVLGLKNLNYFFKQINDFQDFLLKEIKKEIKKSDNENQEKLNIVHRTIYHFVEFLIFIFIKKISYNLSDKNLLDTLEKVVDKNNIPAFEIVDFAVQLNFPNLKVDNVVIDKFNKFDKNRILKDFIKILTVEHLYKFELPISKKQKIFEKLKIDNKKQKKILVNQNKF